MIASIRIKTLPVALGIVFIWAVFSIIGCLDCSGIAKLSILPMCSAKNKTDLSDSVIPVGSNFVIQPATINGTGVKQAPDSPGIQSKVWDIRILIDSRRLAEARKEYEELVRLMARRKESYIAVDSLPVDLLLMEGKKKEAIALAINLTKKIGPSEKWISYLHLIDRKLNSPELKKTLLELEDKHRKHRTQILSRLQAIKPEGNILKDDKLIQMVCHTRCFPRFKLMLKSDRFSADSGVVRYIVSPPNFEKVTLVNDESRNFFSMSIQDLLLDHCGSSDVFDDYDSVTKLASEKFLGLNADVYKISMVGESSYHLLKVARDVRLSAPLYSSVSKICLIHEIGAVPLELKSYHMGSFREILRVERASLGPSTDAYFQLPKNYHPVRSLGELIYAEAGELKNSDLDAFMQGGKRP